MVAACGGLPGGRCVIFHDLERRALGDFAAERLPERASVVGIDLGLGACPRDRHVRQATIQERRMSGSRVDVEQYPLGRRALATVARDRVAVVEVPRSAAADLYRASGVQADGEGPGAVDLLDRAELAVGDTRGTHLYSRRASAVAPSGSCRTARAATLPPQSLAGRRQPRPPGAGVG